MATITEPGPCTLIIVFEVSPERQSELIAGISAEVTRSFRPHPAFISASFHASRDGRRMVNYAQWTTREAYEAFINHNDAGQRAISEVIRRCGAERVAIHDYRVERVVEREAAAHEAATDGSASP